MQAYYADEITLPLPEGHRFPAEKYPRLRQRLISRYPAEALRLIFAAPASAEQIQRVHTVDYYQRVVQGSLSQQEMRRIGLPWSQNLVERALRSTGGSIAAAHAALAEGLAINLGGGTHHAFADHGEGYCVFNDLAVAARELQAVHRIARILILDCDVHQGNGTAAIFRDDPDVFTCSIHGEKNFPFHKEQSDLDIPLPFGTQDEAYLHALRLGLQQVDERFQPEVVFFIAGADAYVHDRYGKLALSKLGLAQRDKMVFEWCHQHGYPVLVVLGGGYAKHVEDVVDIHAATVDIALGFFERMQAWKKRA